MRAVADMICVDKNYSTTRLLTREQPILENKPEDKFESVLFLPNGEDRKGEGGLRTQGYFKKSHADKPLITIVTVVFNGEQFLEETIQSIINQTYDNVEYIIIDGDSTDGTLDIIRQYEHVIDYWVSEGDKGIYDAMNKGIDLAAGNWINFMNCGDYFYEKTILRVIFNKQRYGECQVIYGNQEVRYPSGRKRMVSAGQVDDLWKCSQFCHQAAFVSSQYHKVHKFNLETKIVADYEFFYLAWKNNIKFRAVPQTVCSFDASGVSDGGGMQVFLNIAQVKIRHGIRGRFLAYCEAYYSKLKWSIGRLIWN